MAVSKTKLPGTIAQIKAEHFSRRDVLNSEYDPLLGIGSPLKRFPLDLGGGRVVNLPIPMKNEPIVRAIQLCDGESGASKALEVEIEDVRKQFFECRIRHDYEFWCYTCAKIEDAETNEIIPFKLNKPQLKSMKQREEMRIAQKPVRQIEGKHRQYGSTTEKNCYAFWIQNVVYEKGLNAYLCQLDRDGATEILRRYEVIAENYPKELCNFKLRGYKGARNTQIMNPTGAMVNIGTAEKPNAPSGRTVQMVLLSEVGKMKSTESKGANKLITNMVSMVRLKPNTFILQESTAEESGAYFRDEMERAKNGESIFKLMFISFIDDPRCQIEIPDSELDSFIKSLNKYEIETLWGNGATLEQINWHRQKALGYQHFWQMQQENPATFEEMFQGGKKMKFPPHVITEAKKNVREPEQIGEVEGKADIGSESLEELSFVDNPNGDLKIWLPPEIYKYDFPVVNRYVIYVDIGGTTKNSDYSVIKVLDRAPLLEGGIVECAAEWRGHIDPSILAWKSAQIGKYFSTEYDHPLLAVEYNALNARGNNSDGVHHLTVFNEISNHYPNLYIRKSVDKVSKKEVTYYGFYLTHATKTMIMNSLSKAWQFGGYIERNVLTMIEASQFEIKEDGTMGAMDGKHDDSLVATGGALFLAQDYMEPPIYIKPTEFRPRTQYNEAMV